jgi:hypothetical protein
MLSETVASLIPSCEVSMVTFGPEHTFDISNHSHEDMKASITINLPASVSQADQYVKFTFNDLQGNIGGYLGLYLGVSLFHVTFIGEALQNVFKKYWPRKTSN